MTINKLVAGTKGAAGNSTGAQIAETVNGLVDATASALAGIVAKIKATVGDCNILVSSDSTGNDSNEWVYLYSQYLATLNSQYRVEYYLFNDTTSDYNSAVVMQNGNGTNTLRIYNAAISGSKPDHIMGSRFINVVLNIPKIDCLIMNHGHNCVNSYTEASPINRRTPQLIEAVLQILSYHSGAGVVFLTQNPRRDDDNYAPVYSAILRAASLLNASVADSYKLFLQQGKAASLYSDNIHPSANGTALYLEAIKKLTVDGIPISGLSTLESTTKSNLLVNGDFSVFGDAMPDGWVLGNATCVKNMTESDGLNGYSVSVTSTGATGGLSQNLPASKIKFMKNKIVTLAVRVYIPAGASGSAGRIGILSNSNNTNNYTISSEPREGWCWRTISTVVAETDTYVTIRLYGDSAGNNGTAYFDRAILVVGALPSDCI